MKSNIIRYIAFVLWSVKARVEDELTNNMQTMQTRSLLTHSKRMRAHTKAEKLFFFLDCVYWGWGALSSKSFPLFEVIVITFWSAPFHFYGGMRAKQTQCVSSVFFMYWHSNYQETLYEASKKLSTCSFQTGLAFPFFFFLHPPAHFHVYQRS